MIIANSKTHQVIKLDEAILEKQKINYLGTIVKENKEKD